MLAECGQIVDPITAANFRNRSQGNLSLASVFYFSDTGLAAWLADIATPDALRNSYLNGSFFENFVIIENVNS